MRAALRTGRAPAASASAMAPAATLPEIANATLAPGIVRRATVCRPLATAWLSILAAYRASLLTCVPAVWAPNSIAVAARSALCSRPLITIWVTLPRRSFMNSVARGASLAVRG